MVDQPNILVCTDFSDHSALALRAAEVLRIKTNGKLFILHVSELSVQWDWASSGLMTSYSDTSAHLEILKMLRQKLDKEIQNCGVHGEALVIEGMPFQVIHQLITDKNIHYLFMGKKGKSHGIFPMGSLTEKMVASSHIPLFVIKKKMDVLKMAGLIDPLGPMKGICELTEEISYLFSSRPILISMYKDFAARFIGLGKFGVSTQLLALTEEEKTKITNSLKNQIKNYLTNKIDIEIKVIISNEKKIAYHLNQFLQSESIDLIVMHRHQKGFLEKVIIGSETRRMLEIFEGNIIILPP
jgi:nucleotide-binding universal stress UspA family protein